MNGENYVRDWIQNKDEWLSFVENSNKLTSFIKCGECIEHLRDYALLKEEFCPGIWSGRITDRLND